MKQQKQITRPLLIKSTAEDGTFTGYGSVFHVQDSYKDVVEPGAFTKSIDRHRAKGTMPALLWQHDHATPIGVWRDMQEDGHGLKLHGQLSLDVEKGREAHALLKMGAVAGLSIGYTVPDGGDEFDTDAKVWRVREIDLWETSIVTFPANPDARVTEVRSPLADGDLPTVRAFEKYLREAGFSRSQAEAIVYDGYKSLLTGNVGAGTVLRHIDDILQSNVSRGNSR